MKWRILNCDVDGDVPMGGTAPPSQPPAVEADAPPVVDVAALTAERDQLKAQTEQLAIKVQDFEGTVGRFMHGLQIAGQADPEFANRMNALWQTGSLPAANPIAPQQHAANVGLADTGLDLTDPTALASFIETHTKAAIQESMAPVQQQATNADVTSQFLRLAQEHGQENARIAIPLIQRFVADNGMANINQVPGGFDGLYRIVMFEQAQQDAVAKAQAEEQERIKGAQQATGLPPTGGAPNPDIQELAKTDLNGAIRAAAEQLGVKLNA